MDDDLESSGRVDRIFNQISDVKANVASLMATLAAMQDETKANRDRFHRLNDSLQSIVLQLDPIYKAMPSIQAKIQSFDDLKNKGIGVILAASAAGAVLVEAGRYLVSWIHISR